MPNVTIGLATSGQTMVRSASDETYGEIEYSYAGRSATTRSTSHREALPLLYGLAGKPIPAPIPGDDYPELEADSCVDTVAGQPAIGHEIHFFSFDLTNTCWTRSFYAAGGTALLMWQVNDLELDQSEDILRAICASVEIDD